MANNAIRNVQVTQRDSNSQIHDNQYECENILTVVALKEMQIDNISNVITDLLTKF